MGLSGQGEENGLTAKKTEMEGPFCISIKHFCKTKVVGEEGEEG